MTQAKYTKTGIRAHSDTIEYQIEAEVEIKYEYQPAEPENGVEESAKILDVHLVAPNSKKLSVFEYLPVGMLVNTEEELANWIRSQWADSLAERVM